ncbi:glycosyltransferase, exosortase A system-associated [Aestuariicella sp. G3-2]|uniref:TIGR04063 family PEP-CTERM/XrtA system glycosyltransferase n=1 Tax=Pseudomaricurvus albidus TaxID=2842452 RepID=UPI001C0BB6BD|nr:TIGR04063 family PEP-CTERM/XrtA system glycosyltransferase [Aestuariicella albida]MBU3070881.1 glycosyltransferase, exosortase A system-associated [Aestuariicella albida]
MKILHILDHSIPLHSGYTFRTLSILRHQRAMGWQTEHLTSAKHDVEIGAEKYIEREEVDGLHFFRTQRKTGGWHNYSLAEPLSVIRGLTQRLHEVVDEVRPDVLHAHSPALNGIAALKVGKARNIPVVYECRAFWEDAAVNHGTCDARSLRYFLTRRLESHVFHRADAVTTICEGLRKDIIARGVDPHRITVIPNAVDIERFQVCQDKPQALIKLHGLDNKIVLGFFGSFYEYEGLSFLLDAMPMIVRQNPSVKLLLVGGGPQEAIIQRKVKMLKLEKHVLVLGRVPHDTIQDFYNAVDIMVYPRLPMRLTDLVTPLKPLEAMAQGKLVVASDVGGHQELIADKETGYLFKAGDLNAAAETILTAIKERDVWGFLQSNGRQYVEGERNWKASTERYNAVYAPILSGGL